jgi:2-polyprenyl-3-methyl-5-hydroxy-6-metoxy-1,4-benzoquinol methylase
MNLKDLKRTWDEFGKTDPLWAILTNSDKKGNKWQINEFFETGVGDVKRVMVEIDSLCMPLHHGKALDFGCGAGRLTQALVPYFDEVQGVDIAPSMIELAKEYNHHREKCKYHVNETNDLRLFPDKNFDFIISFITLQHMEPKYAKTYITEFIRILAPKGILVFQQPTGERKFFATRLEGITPPTKSHKEGFRVVITFPLKIIWGVYAFVDHQWKTHFGIFKGRGPRMELYGIKREVVTKLIEGNGARIIDIKEDGCMGPKWVSLRYFVTKE